MLGTRIDALGFGAAHPSSRASLQHQFPSEGQGSRSWLWQCKHLLYYLMPLQNYNVNSTCVYGFLFFNPFFTIFIFLGYYRHFFFFFWFFAESEIWRRNDESKFSCSFTCYTLRFTCFTFLGAIVQVFNELGLQKWFARADILFRELYYVP